MIVGANFILSLDKFHKDNCHLNEVVFLGRSNVGKSSLINSLCKQKQLARSSTTPGKTQLINVFEILCKKDERNFKIHFIDLPGFGYARVSKRIRGIWDKNLDEFLRLRTSIKLFLHLIDSRHTKLSIDLEVEDYLRSFLHSHQRVLKVFTKSDKLKQGEKIRLKNEVENAILVSNLNKKGIGTLENEIMNFLDA